jgi:hypothetical protein
MLAPPLLLLLDESQPAMQIEIAIVRTEPINGLAAGIVRSRIPNNSYDELRNEEHLYALVFANRNLNSED